MTADINCMAGSQIRTPEKRDSLTDKELEELVRMVYELLLNELDIENNRTGKELRGD